MFRVNSAKLLYQFLFGMPAAGTQVESNRTSFQSLQANSGCFQVCVHRSVICLDVMLTYLSSNTCHHCLGFVRSRWRMNKYVKRTSGAETAVCKIQSGDE